MVCALYLPYTVTLEEEALYDQDGNILSGSLFHAARLLLFQQPAMLCDNLKQEYGGLGCIDLNSYFLRAKCNGRDRAWGFDPYDNGQPAEIIEFAKHLQTLKIPRLHFWPLESQE